MRRFLSTQPLSRLVAPSIELLETQKGVPGLFSQETVNQTWNQHSTVLVDDLNFAINESINANLEQIVAEKSAPSEMYHRLMKQTALDPRDALAFNSASAMYNLTLFFSSLKGNSSNKVSQDSNRGSLLETPNYSELIASPPADNVLLEKMVKSFGSWEEFITLFMASAMSLQGNGYTWLVLRSVEGNLASDAFKNNASLAVVNTYNNGTPTALTKGQIAAVSAHMAVNNGSNPSAGVYKARENTDKILSVEEAQSVEPFEYIGVPLLGVPSNPAFFLRDYGVFGKNTYLQNALRCVDWEVVSARFKSLITADKRK